MCSSLARLAEGTLYNSLSSEKIDPAIVSENLNQYVKLAWSLIQILINIQDTVN